MGEKRILLEASLKQKDILLQKEIQKRKLLESQTRRLTAELTKYLDAEMDADDAKEQQMSPTNANQQQQPQMQVHYRKASMNAKAGWLKFLSSSNKNTKKKMMRKSINNIKEKINSKKKNRKSTETEEEK